MICASALVGIVSAKTKAMSNDSKWRTLAPLWLAWALSMVLVNMVIFLVSVAPQNFGALSGTTGRGNRVAKRLDCVSD